MKAFTFIENHALRVDNCLPVISIPEIMKKWNHYETEKNLDIMKFIWNHIHTYIPKKCNNHILKGYSLDRTIIIKNFNKDIKFEKEKTDKNGNISLLNVFIFCEKGQMRFHGNGLKFVNPDASYYDVNTIHGNLAIFTNKVSYQSTEQYILKIPIFYRKKLEIPTPNGEKYKKIQFLNNGNLVVLSPNLKDENVIKRWKEVEKKNFHKHNLPDYIDQKRGRPPTNEEDYCPNCFEILPLKFSYSNCSGCLSDIF